MDIVSLIEAGSASLTYLVFAGIVLGGLHGLEPGHSKTMMAAFIIAVRGTAIHAVLLGVSAALSHSLIVWLLAALALAYGNELLGEELEPYFLIASGLLVLVIGLVMLARIPKAHAPHSHPHPHPHPHPHSHGHSHEHGDAHTHAHDHNHHHEHPHESDHDHAHHEAPANTAAHAGAEDAHARAHAQEIESRFASGRATWAQTIGFGLTGGLIPCPAAITVLLLCLNIDKPWLGAGMVGAFSAGLALTLVLSGLVAAWGMKVARSRVINIDVLYRKAPYVSGVLIIVIGCYMAASGWTRLA